MLLSDASVIFQSGRPFTVFTDHKPLTFALSSASFRSPRQSGPLSFVSEFTNDIRHIKGEDNITADTLSRVFVVSESSLPTVDYTSFAVEQTHCPDLVSLRNETYGLSLRLLPHEN